MNVDQPKAVVQRWLDAWGDSWVGPEAVDGLFTDVVVDHTPAPEELSRDLFKERLVQLCQVLGRAQFDGEEMIGELDRVVVSWTVRGTLEKEWMGAAAGTAYALPGANMFRVAGDRIAARWSWVDLRTLIGPSSSSR